MGKQNKPKEGERSKNYHRKLKKPMGPDCPGLEGAMSAKATQRDAALNSMFLKAFGTSPRLISRTERNERLVQRFGRDHLSLYID